MESMPQFNVHEAKTKLSQLLTMVERGEQVTIMRDGTPIADLVRHRGKTKRPLGLFRGQLELPEGWDAPMSDEQAERFLEGKDE